MVLKAVVLMVKVAVAVNATRGASTPASAPATPRQEKTAELRPPMGVGLGGMLTPTAKRPMHHEEPLETRPPMPASPTHHQPLTPSLPSIKISSRGNGRSQDQSIVVSMEINGILYQGVLFPQAPRTRLS
nr:uncharacterized protein LOC113812835 [Penaeus vannamei]